MKQNNNLKRKEEYGKEKSYLESILNNYDSILRKLKWEITYPVSSRSLRRAEKEYTLNLRLYCRYKRRLLKVEKKYSESK